MLLQTSPAHASVGEAEPPPQPAVTARAATTSVPTTEQRMERRNSTPAGWQRLVEPELSWSHADVAQLVEHQLPKLRVAGSNPVVRFFSSRGRSHHALFARRLLRSP